MIMKTVIFSALVPTIEFIANDLEKRGIKVVKITGSNTGRMNSITEFQNDDSVRVLCATTQTLSTGVTLTEAKSKMFFLWNLIAATLPATHPYAVNWAGFNLPALFNNVIMEPRKKRYMY